LHENVHALLTQTPRALATFVEHAWPQVLQFAPSLVVSTQLPLQRVGATVGQPETHEYEPPAPAQTGAPASGLHATPQLPQLSEVEYWTHAPLQRLYPLLQAVAQVPSTHSACAFAMLVEHALPQAAQFAGVPRSKQPPSQSTIPAGQPPSDEGAVTSSPAPSESLSTVESAAPPSARGETDDSPAPVSAPNITPVEESGVAESTAEPDAQAVTSAAAPAIATKGSSARRNRWLSKAPHINPYLFMPRLPDETSKPLWVGGDGRVRRGRS